MHFFSQNRKTGRAKQVWISPVRIRYSMFHCTEHSLPCQFVSLRLTQPGDKFYGGFLFKSTIPKQPLSCLSHLRPSPQSGPFSAEKHAAGIPRFRFGTPSRFRNPGRDTGAASPSKACRSPSFRRIFYLLFPIQYDISIKVIGFERENNEFALVREDRSSAASLSAGCRLVRPGAVMET